LWLADEVASVPVLIARAPSDEASLYQSIEHMLARGRRFYADPILDPIPFGLTASIVRYYRLRERFPQVPILMGVANLTELLDADTTGINAVLLGIAAELRVAAILTTQVAEHARRVVREVDIARRIMYAAREDNALPKGISDQLLTVHARHPYTDTPAEIIETARAILDPNFRVQVAVDGVHVYNRDGHHVARDAFELWPRLQLNNDGAHAFYMGVELARAEIAYLLGKRYVQDQPLDWGVAVDRPGANLETWCASGTTMQKRPDQVT
jgi:dihydropteroate synthase-like protein